MGELTPCGTELGAVRCLGARRLGLDTGALPAQYDFKILRHVDLNKDLAEKTG
jgi:hypothetical protein